VQRRQAIAVGIYVKAVSVTARFGLRWETCWARAMVEKKRDKGFLRRLHCIEIPVEFTYVNK
jgi:hypothetical protein